MAISASISSARRARRSLATSPHVISHCRPIVGHLDDRARSDEQFSRIVVLTKEDDRRSFKRLAHLVELTAMAVAAASDASSKLIATVERALPPERT